MSESDRPTTSAKGEPAAISTDGAGPAPAEPAMPQPEAEPLTFREKLEAGRFIVSVEVDPPHGLGARKAIDGTRLLKEAGVDVINVGDSPTAKIRMSPLAMSTLLMRGKVEAGAHFFVTQNVFEEKKLEAFLDGAAKFKKPVIVGVLPLANSRHAEFLHNEVPGMFLPDKVRDRMRKAGEERGPKEGQAMARDTIALCRAKAAGVYLVPSFGRYELVAELVAEIAR